MSVSSAISNAISGLSAASRGTETVSSNIANALTPGYARRGIDLAPRHQGGGVGVMGIDRLINAALLADNRLAQAEVGHSNTIATFHATMEEVFGTTGSTMSLGSKLTQFGSAMASAAARPDSVTRLTAVLDAATSLTSKIHDIELAIQSERLKAEQAIEGDIGRMNQALERIATLNGQIVAVSSQGKDASALMDTRQAEIDAIAQIVPIKEVTRENGRVALFTDGGATLLDGTAPARIGFDRTAQISAGMSLPGGQLSTLTFNDKPLSSAQMDMFSGGRLAASFDIRDRLAPQYQQQIDAFSRELYDRFADPAVDPSLNSGAPGIFTDAQGRLSPTDELGFAGRIAVNAAIDPDAGGAVWRIRAGMNAANAGNAGDGALLGRMETTFSAPRDPVSATLSSGKRTLATLASEISSGAASGRIRSAADALQSQTRHSSLNAALLADGVDTDREMESLLALERAYSANAKVFQTANDMLDAILRLT